MFLMAKRMTTDYRHLGILLGLDSDAIDVIELDNRGSVVNITFKIIENWNRSNENHSLGEMYDILQHALSEINRNDLITVLSEGM